MEINDQIALALDVKFKAIARDFNIPHQSCDRVVELRKQIKDGEIRYD